MSKISECIVFAINVSYDAKVFFEIYFENERA